MAIYINCFAEKSCSTASVLVNVILIAFTVCVGFALFFLGFSFVLFKFAVIKRLHNIFSIHGTVNGRNQWLLF